MKSVLNIHWKDWCWNSNTLATWCEELTYWKRSWCWKRLKAGGEGDNRGWDGWMASLTQWTWVWVNSGSWWWTVKPGVLQSMGSQRVGHDWVNWTELKLTLWPIEYIREQCFHNTSFSTTNSLLAIWYWRSSLDTKQLAVTSLQSTAIKLSWSCLSQRRVKWETAQLLPIIQRNRMALSL